MEALKNELVDALISDGRALPVDGDRSLSVEARDGRGRVDPRVMGPQTTLMLRVRGRDLEALREGRLTAEEMRRRIRVP